MTAPPGARDAGLVHARLAPSIESPRRWIGLAALAVALLGWGCESGRSEVAAQRPGRDAEAQSSAQPVLMDAGEGPAEIADADTSPVAPPIDASDAELRRRAREDPRSLGSLSMGRPEAGALVNGLRLTEGPHWRVAYPDNAWATAETIRALVDGLTATYERLPGDAPATYVGDLSAPWGGPLSPHKSHQSGRDVDVGYFRADPADPWWENATARTLDVARTWVLLRTFITETDVEVIFVDRSLQALLRAHALRIGEDPAWLDRLFDLGRAERGGLIRHEPEHRNHLHLRFYNPQAQRIGRVVHDLMEKGIAPGPMVVVPERLLPPSRR